MDALFLALVSLSVESRKESADNQVHIVLRSWLFGMGVLAS